MSLATVVRDALLSLDVGLMRQAWAQASPHLPQPASDADALAAMHMARTSAESLPLRARVYSHRWLAERGLPSQLPDRLRPATERVEPRAVAVVGVSVNSRYAVVGEAIEAAMVHAVQDCYANGDTSPEIVKPQMMAARRREQIALGTRARWDRLVPVRS